MGDAELPSAGLTRCTTVSVPENVLPFHFLFGVRRSGDNGKPRLCALGHVPLHPGHGDRQY